MRTMSDLRNVLRPLTSSVFVKCSAIMALTTLTVSFVLTQQAFQLSSETVVRSVQDTGRRAVTAGAGQMVDPVRFEAMQQIALTAERAIEDAGTLATSAVVLRADGTLLNTSGKAEGADFDLAVTLATEAAAQGSLQISDDGMVMAAPVMRGADQPVLGAFAMVWNAETPMAVLRTQLNKALAYGSAVFLLMLVVTTFLLRRIVGRPVAVLRNTISEVSRGNYDVESNLPRRKDEFGDMARQMSDLVKVLQTARTAEQNRQADQQEQSNVVRFLSKGLVALAEGVLTHKISDRFPDQYESLRENYNCAVESLRDAIQEVRTSADSIRSGADEIAAASESLSHRTETQAATLEQTAAALEELVSSVNSAADGARQVDETVKSANAMTEHNATIMKNAVSAMAEIEKSSDQIGEIIGVIDDIAFQTNLLALNAGVEAARAGTAGKGFAVVASEVRALAQRSSHAAQQIKSLISGSSLQVKTGAQLVEQAGTAMLEVVDRVQYISGLVSDIAHGASEQSLGINEINIGVTSLDQVTQQNAAMVEESSAATMMLNTDAQKLAELVAKFQLASEDALAQARPPVERAA